MDKQLGGVGQAVAVGVEAGAEAEEAGGDGAVAVAAVDDAGDGFVGDEVEGDVGDGGAACVVDVGRHEESGDVLAGDFEGRVGGGGCDGKLREREPVPVEKVRLGVDVQRVAGQGQRGGGPGGGEPHGGARVGEAGEAEGRDGWRGKGTEGRGATGGGGGRGAQERGVRVVDEGPADTGARGREPGVCYKPRAIALGHI